MSYLVVACTGCGSPRVVPADNKTAQCHRCGSRTTVDEAIVHARTDSLQAAQNAVGQVNAKREGGELAEAAVETPEPRDAIDRALADARGVTSERMRVQLAAEGLTEELSTFDADAWVAALERLDVERARALEHLERLKHASVVTEPTHGEYRFVD